MTSKQFRIVEAFLKQLAENWVKPQIEVAWDSSTYSFKMFIPGEESICAVKGTDLEELLLNIADYATDILTKVRDERAAEVAQLDEVLK